MRSVRTVGLEASGRRGGAGSEIEGPAMVTASRHKTMQMGSSVTVGPLLGTQKEMASL